MSWWLSLLTGAVGGGIGALLTAWATRRNSQDQVAEQRHEAGDAGDRWRRDFDAAQQRWQRDFEAGRLQADEDRQAAASQHHLDQVFQLYLVARVELRSDDPAAQRRGQRDLERIRDDPTAGNLSDAARRTLLDELTRTLGRVEDDPEAELRQVP